MVRGASSQGTAVRRILFNLHIDRTSEASRTIAPDAHTIRTIVTIDGIHRGDSVAALPMPRDGGTTGATACGPTATAAGVDVRETGTSIASDGESADASGSARSAPNVAARTR